MKVLTGVANGDLVVTFERCPWIPLALVYLAP